MIEIATSRAFPKSGVSTDRCPFCDAPGNERVRDARDYLQGLGGDAQFSVRVCAPCHVGYTLPSLTEAELERYYPDDYQAYVPKDFFLGALLKVKYRRDLSLIQRLVPPGTARLMEIGAGRGEFLAEARRRGYSVEGLEPGHQAREIAKRTFSLTLTAGSASAMHFSSPFDVIVARHVLEHLNRPDEALREIHAKGLKEGGLLFLKFPNFDCWESRVLGKYWDGWDVPRHRIHFTPEGIRKLLAAIGFRDISVRPETVPSVVNGVRNFARYGENGPLKVLAHLVSALPSPLRFAFGQTAALALSPWGLGRMIVTARK